MLRPTVPIALALSITAALAFAIVAMPPMALSQDVREKIVSCEAYQRLHLLLLSSERADAFSVNDCRQALTRP